VCGTVVMPGSVKRNHESLVIARQLVEQLQAAGMQVVQQNDAATGFEAYAVTSMSAIDAKRATVAIEDSHPLGRLMDIDVIDPQGVPMSRNSVGAEPRRCLLCDHEARWCMRNHTHTTSELLEHITRVVGDFEQANSL